MNTMDRPSALKLQHAVSIMDETPPLDPQQLDMLIQMIVEAGGLQLARPAFEDETRQAFEDVPGLETLSTSIIDALVESLWAGYRAVAIRGHAGRLG